MANSTPLKSSKTSVNLNVKASERSIQNVLNFSKSLEVLNSKVLDKRILVNLN